MALKSYKNFPNFYLENSDLIILKGYLSSPLPLLIIYILGKFVYLIEKKLATLDSKSYLIPHFTK